MLNATAYHTGPSSSAVFQGDKIGGKMGEGDECFG